MGGSSKKAKVTEYYFDIHMGLGLPLDELVEIRASDKRAWRGSVTNNSTININQPNLFGGPESEGGLVGSLQVYFGDESQTISSRLVSMLGGIAPMFRGFSSAFYSGLLCTSNPYPKPWTMLRRGGNRLWGNQAAWYPERQFIWLADGAIKAMNPVHILYQIRTSQLFRGWPRAWMDDAAWRAAADVCYTENLGLCLEWRSTDTFKNFNNMILEHISAEILDDRRTGLISIRMLRDDYDPADLPLYDEDSGLLELLDDESPTINDMPSDMHVKYIDAIDGQEKTIRVSNSAVAARGWRSTETVDYPGAPTAEIAARLGHRDLGLKTAGMRRYKVILDRRGSGVNLGDAIRIRSLRRGIQTVVVRVAKIQDGKLTNGKITLTVLQDIFSVPATTFVSVPPPGWLPPDRTPQPVATRQIFEAGWRDLVLNIDPANLELVHTTAAYVAMAAIAPTSMSLNYELTTRVGTSGNFIEQGIGDFTPSALLTIAINRTETAITLSSITLPDDIVVGSAAMLGSEIVRIDAINLDSGTCTIGRGCLDTVPVSHNAGTRLWFYDDWAGFDTTAYSMSTTVQARLLTNTSEGQLDPAFAGTDSLALVARQGRPYPPGLFRINGVSYPTDEILDNQNIVVTWRHRDRLQQADQIIDTSIGNIGPEPGTSYTVELRRPNNTIIASESGITGTTCTFTPGDIGSVYGDIIVRLFAMRAGIASYQTHVWTIERVAPPAPPVYPGYWPNPTASESTGA